MHLHPQLALKDIVHFPDMLDQLAGAVDAKIGAFLSNKGAQHLPRVDKLSILHHKQVSKVLDKEQTWVVSHEITLQTSYLNLQQYPALVASTLVTGLDEWSSIFQYSEKPTVTTACAEADRYLSLNMSAIEKAGIPEDLKTKLQLVVDKDLSDFLFWEFKSMNAGTMGVMLAIFHLMGSEFPWFRCPVSKHCDSQFCQKKNNRFRSLSPETRRALTVLYWRTKPVKTTRTLAFPSSLTSQNLTAQWNLSKIPGAGNSRSRSSQKRGPGQKQITGIRLTLTTTTDMMTTTTTMMETTATASQMMTTLYPSRKRSIIRP